MLILKPPSRRDGAMQPPFTATPNPDAIDVFDMSFIAGTPVHCEVISLRPASRDLSGDARSGNIHQHAVRRRPKPSNNKHALSNKLPTYLQPLHQLRSARPSLISMRLGSDAASNLSITQNTWKPPDISSLHNVCRTGIWLIRTDANFYFPIRIIRLPPNRARGPRRSFGGPSGAPSARQDRIWWS